ncbi:hypothetical protein E2C01_040335 [Portunus trituberculatus]|uniref:Uncharacterized protein n=1 Tax=Portunus trituberculatus TaxID=210409 RepID=A0A5B7FNI0_PORTR|nr:hypothetical protein [Portunus trituberculatus]
MPTKDSASTIIAGARNATQDLQSTPTSVEHSPIAPPGKASTQSLKDSSRSSSTMAIGTATSSQR